MTIRRSIRGPRDVCIALAVLLTAAAGISAASAEEAVAKESTHVMAGQADNSDGQKQSIRGSNEAQGLTTVEYIII